MRKKVDDREIKQLDDIAHLLLRPNTFIGSVTPDSHEQWVLDSEGLVSWETLTYTEGLYKIISEILENSIDEGLKTDWKYSNKISVDIKDDVITITDNGRGLPCKKTEEGEWMPVIAFTKLRAGSNFSDDGRISIGTNGFGAALTNVFSKKFECITCDGRVKLKISCSDNLSKTKVTELTATEKTGTKVEFIPDYERFGCSCLQENIIALLKTRLKFLAYFYPKCTFIFNDEKMGIKRKDLASMFPSPNITLNTENVYLCLYPSDEARSLSYVNGISLRRCGKHVDYILNEITNNIREKISKKYKNIKPADIKNRLGIVVLFKDFPNCTFDSQTKESLENSQGDISSYLKECEVDLDKFSQKVIREKEILDNITEIFQLKEDLKEKKDLQKLNSKKKIVNTTKYIPPVGDKKYLCITEGDSAYGGIAPVLGRKGIGYYQIKGKILNIQELSLKKAMENVEIADLVNILGIDLADPYSNIDYEKVLIASDADADGAHISSLLLALFNRICPKILKEGRICRLNTPVLVGIKGTGKNREVKETYYTLPDQSKLNSKLSYIYQKGLGGWGGENKDLFKQILEKEKGLEGLLLQLTPDNNTNKSLKNWMGDTSDYRKSALRGKVFSIEGV